MNTELKDPVCGMIGLPDIALSLVWTGETVHFCSDYCRTKFQENPRRYMAAAVSPEANDAKASRHL